MKKILYILVLILVVSAFFTACKGKVNTSSLPGSDYSTIESSSSEDEEKELPIIGSWKILK